jgi:hypothetical protein
MAINQQPNYLQRECSLVDPNADLVPSQIKNAKNDSYAQSTPM